MGDGFGFIVFLSKFEDSISVAVLLSTLNPTKGPKKRSKCRGATNSVTPLYSCIFCFSCRSFRHTFDAFILQRICWSAWS